MMEFRDRYQRGFTGLVQVGLAESRRVENRSRRGITPKG